VLSIPGGSVRGGAGGVIDLREATAESVNTYFYQLARDVGPQRIAELANRIGVTRIDPNRKDYAPQITFGQYEVSPLDMAAGYSVFANHGIKPGVTPVAKLIDSDGKVLEDNTAPHGSRVLAAAVADWTTEMLRGPVERGTAASAVHLGRPAAGKTGTTNDYKDAWFVGFVPQLATAVWMGHSDGPKRLNVKGINGVYGGSFPAQTWNTYMKGALDGTPAVPFAAPGLLPLPSSGVRRVPDDAQVAPELPRDCGGPCLATPNLTSPTTAPPEDHNGEDCTGECDSKGSP
jgi:penicillin-binding protein 1A